MSNDPYAAPSADLQTDASAIKTSIWTAKGRLGVLSYLAHSFVLVIAISVVSGILGFAVFSSQFSAIVGSPESIDFSNPALLVPLLIIIPLFLLAMYIGICLLIKRLHDRGHSGWWALPLTVLSFIPIVGFITLIGFAYVMFFRGHKTANVYGGQRTTKGWEKVLGILYIIIIFGALIAGVASIATLGLGVLSS